jgi:hypothetical protein
MPKIDIPWEVLDEVALASLKDHYQTYKEDITLHDKKLLKALKRVIEYYGGNVDE